MKKALLLLVALAMLSGCAILDTNIPLFYNNDLEVVNLSDYHLEIRICGHLMERDGKPALVQSGDTVAIRFPRNLTGYAAERTVSAKAFNADGKVVGASVYRSYQHSSGYQRCDVWRIYNEDLARR